MLYYIYEAEYVILNKLFSFFTSVFLFYRPTISVNVRPKHCAKQSQ